MSSFQTILVEKEATTGFASASGGGLTVALNTEITPELVQDAQGLATAAKLRCKCVLSSGISVTMSPAQ